MCTMNKNTPLLVKLSILTLLLLLPSATSSYPSHSSRSPSPSPSPSPLVESPLSPSDSPSPTQSYSPPAPPSPSPAPAPSHSPTTEDSPSAPADNTPFIPTPPPVAESVTNTGSINYVNAEPMKNKSSGGGHGVGVAFGLIGAACLVIFGGAVYKKRRDNIRRSRRYSRVNIQLI